MKPYSLTFATEDGYLFAKVAGEVSTLEQLSEKAHSIMGKVLELGMKRVLVDDRELSVHVDVHDAHCLANEMDGANLQVQGFRIACLYVAEHADIYRIFETGHRNRSLNFRAFTDQEAALKWLTA